MAEAKIIDPPPAERLVQLTLTMEEARLLVTLLGLEASDYGESLDPVYRALFDDAGVENYLRSSLEAVGGVFTLAVDIP